MLALALVMPVQLAIGSNQDELSRASSEEAAWNLGLSCSTAKRSALKVSSGLKLTPPLNPASYRNTMISRPPGNSTLYG